MRNSLKAVFAALLAASVLTLSACGTQGQPAPDAPDSAVSGSDTAVSDTDVSDTDVSDNEFVLPEFTPEEPAPGQELKHVGIPGFYSAPESTQVGAVYESSLPAKMWSGYITDRKEVIDLPEIRICLDEGVYVPGYTAEYVEKIVDALEQASGLSYSKAKNNEYKITLNVEKTENYEYDDFISEGELGAAWAALSHTKDLHLSSGDLLLGMSNAMVHEMSHTLHASQNEMSFCQLLNEGFAEYNAYKATKLLEKNDPAVAYALDWSGSSVYNMDISDPSTVYTQSIEYWFENDFPFEYSGNGPYSLGFRFMAYLDHVYGNYSEWLVKSAGLDAVGSEYDTETQIKLIKAVYGEDVMDGFYPWLQKNEDMFAVNYTSFFDEAVYDLTKADSVTLYPSFYSWECNTDLMFSGIRAAYSDLYVNMEECRRYLSEYKSRSVDGLELYIQWYNGGGTVELFDIKGNSLGERTTDEAGGALTVDLDGVGCVLLKGDGVLEQFSVTGYEGYKAK